MSLRFLAVEAIASVHTRAIERFGGANGLHDRGLLESAMARAENLVYYNPEVSARVRAANFVLV